MNEAKHRFFCSDIQSGFLSPEESNHAIRVLRLKENDLIQVIDGNGNLALATILNNNKDNLIFKVISITKEIKPETELHIAIAPTKSIDRFEFFLEKVTEIGISKVTPLITKNSERKEIKTEKLRKNLISAVKQSGNLFLPEISESIPFIKFIASENNLQTSKFIAHCFDDKEKKELKSELNKQKKIIILVGPEGDFTTEEINLAKQNGYIPVSLGKSRLRTETAGIIACHTVNLLV